MLACSSTWPSRAARPIRKLYLGGQGRFSLDLDFTATTDNDLAFRSVFAIPRSCR